MSVSSNDSPIQPLHNPFLAAQVVLPEAPLGNNASSKQPSAMGAKALLAKKLAHNANPAFISPTDSMMTPCTQKLNAAKKKHFNKLTKPVQLFASQKAVEEELETAHGCDHDAGGQPPSTTSEVIMADDDENPF